MPTTMPTSPMPITPTPSAATLPPLVEPSEAPVVPSSPVLPPAEPSPIPVPVEPVTDPDPVLTMPVSPASSPMSSFTPEGNNMPSLPPLGDQFPVPSTGITEVAGAPIEEEPEMPKNSRSLYVIIFVLLVLVTLLAGLSLLLLLRG